MKPLPGMVLVITCAAVLAGCGTTVRENQYNETPINQKVSTTYYHDTEVVYARPTYRLVPVRPSYQVVPVTRYYYVD